MKKTQQEQLMDILVKVSEVGDSHSIEYHPFSTISFYNFDLEGSPDSYCVLIQTLTRTGEVERLKVLTKRANGRWAWRTVTLSQLSRLVDEHVRIVESKRAVLEKKAG